MHKEIGTIALGMLVMTSTASAWDVESCAQAAEVLTRAAIDTANAAETLRTDTTARSVAHMRTEFSILESRLNRAVSECGIGSRASSALSRKDAEERALAQIEVWEKELIKRDRNYSQVKDRMMKLIAGPIRRLPPEYWLTTMQLMYEAAAAP